MARFVLHFGHNVYLTADGGMTRKITEARVFSARSEANQVAKAIVKPPFCAPMRPQPNPPDVESLDTNEPELDLILDIPPKLCRIH